MDYGLVDADVKKAQQYIASIPDTILQWQQNSVTVPTLDINYQQDDIIELDREIQRARQGLSSYLVNLKLMTRTGETMIANLKAAQKSLRTNRKNVGDRRRLSLDLSIMQADQSVEIIQQSLSRCLYQRQNLERLTDALKNGAATTDSVLVSNLIMAVKMTDSDIKKGASST